MSVINIDTIPPESPAGPSALGRDGSVFLKWPEKDDKDVLEYKVYRSDLPRDGYDEIARTQLNKYHDKGLENGKPYYYKLSALDRAGNESTLTGSVPCTPLKPGPTVVSQNIAVDTVWYAVSSPYIIKKKIEIMNGATLTIEPGSVVESEGPAIVVRGILLAKGTENNFIQFTGAGDGKEGGAWEGIIFDNTNDEESRIQYSKIKQAKTAVAMLASSPSLSHNTITKNDTGIRVTEFSKPKVTENTIIGNKGTGILCERSEPEITGNTISENGGGGILCRNAVPIIRNNNITGNNEFDLSAENRASTMVAALDNWWGSKDHADVSKRIKGLVSYPRVLDGPYPNGKPVDLKKSEKTAVKPEKPDIKKTEAQVKMTPLEISLLMKEARGLMMKGKSGGGGQGSPQQDCDRTA